MDVSATPGVLEIPYALAFKAEQHSDLAVYLAIAHFIRGGINRPSHGSIAELAQISRETVSASLKRLVAGGYITVDKEAAPHAYSLAA
jgi:6,7-dimethyl-8-ribityllumazine synthase